MEKCFVAEKKYKKCGLLQPIVSEWKRLYVICICFAMFFSLSCEKAYQPAEIAVHPEEEDLSIPELPIENKRIFRMHMNSLDDSYESLTDSIDRQDWNGIRTFAMQMKNSSPVLFTGKGKNELPQDFVLLDTRFHYHTLALVEASETKEMVNLNLQFENIKETCDDCHVKYKRKDS